MESSYQINKKFDDKKHGEVTCINCHVADGRYHQGNPRGSVANSSYIEQDTTQPIQTAQNAATAIESKS